MKRYKIIRFLSGSGEDVHILTNADGMPCYLPNLYATAKLRQGARSTLTVRQHLDAVRGAMEWFAARTGDDFNDRMINGEPLLFEEAKPLGDFLKLNAKRRNFELAVESESNDRGNRKPKVRRLESVRPKRVPFVESVVDRVGDSTAAQNIKHVCAYLEWLYKMRRRAPLSANFGPERQALAQEGMDQLRAQSPRIRVRSNEDERLWSLPLETVELVESIVRPDSDRNPWKNSFIAERNYLMWKMFYDTGGRRDEVRNIKVGDLHLSIPAVDFRVSKTIPRTVPFTIETAVLVNRFVIEHWDSLPGAARESDYLFTNSQGQQMSVRAVNEVFERIRRCDPGVPDWLTPHTLRRTWNENFSRTLDALPADEKWGDGKEAMVRNRLMGWSETGKTAHAYLRRHTRSSAGEIVERMFAGDAPTSDADGGDGNAK